MGEWRRTHWCGALTAADVGTQVTLAGWVQRRRDLGGLIFIDLRDSRGLVQVVFRPGEAEEAYRAAEGVRSEYVLAVTGIVQARPADAVNPRLPTGAIEVRAVETTILNEALTPPFLISDEVEVDESVRLRYRYLDLRRPQMQRNLVLRHRMGQSIRGFLDHEGFVEVETPYLIKSTPEGARDFLVPARLQPGKFYVLAQSPQLFKQILMVAGLDRYFQIVRCFRDEDLRADRQPEFTQVDIEMSFVDQEDILSLVERLMAAVMRDAPGVEVPVPFPRLTYAEAMARYGSDKPDLRFGLEIVGLSAALAGTRVRALAQALETGGAVGGIVVPGGAGMSRREVDEVTAVAQEAGLVGLIPVAFAADGVRSPIARHLSGEEVARIRQASGAGEGDLLLVAAADPARLAPALGRVRLELARRLGAIPEGTYRFVWVTEFPLMEHSEEEGRFVAVHHPFTAPLDEDLPGLEEAPLHTRAKAYDLVLNGVELGGGSIRIHRRDLQERIFRLLGLTPEAAVERFGFLLEAFQYGAPPHGGIALGLDRLVMLLAGEQTIREVVAFPKTQSGVDLMTGAPTDVDERQLRDLGLARLDRPR